MATPQTYQELGYQQPRVAATEATNAALTVIEDLLLSSPGLLPYVLQPSSILVFANLRAQSPYHEFGKEVTPAQVQQLSAILQKHNIAIWNDDTRYGEPKSGVFSLVNTVVFEDIPNQYGFAQKIWFTPVATPTVEQICEWVLVTERALAGLMESDVLPSEWLADWWAPHNLRFGMLLGYPGAAISSSLWATAEAKLKHTQLDLTECIIVEEQKYMYGSRVGFFVKPDVANDPSVHSIQRLWSEVVANVLRAMPLQKLLSNKDFAEGYQNLERREKS